MDERALFNEVWENESKTTRNVIARIPEGSTYRPDPKSRTASEIAWQIACEEKMLIEALETGKAEWNPPPAPATIKDLLDIYEMQCADIVRRLKALPRARWDGSLEFFGSERPASPMAWSFLFDIVHHRGQISTYLRPMGSTVPQIYGPSGDVWRTDGQAPRQRRVDVVVGEILDLRRRGFRFVALADDNFYPVTLTDLAMAERQGNVVRLEQLRALRTERFELMDRLAHLPSDMVFFTQITMEAAEDAAFLTAMRRANIKGALVGVEAVTPEGLKDVYKSFNDVGEALVARLRTFRDHGVGVLGSFIFGLPSDRPSTFAATADIADRAGLAFAQFVMLTPYPGTVDFAAWEKSLGEDATRIAGVPVTRHWLIPQAQRPKVHPIP